MGTVKKARPAGDTFTVERMNWLKAVCRDASMPPMAFRVAFAISGYINRETGDAWPGQARLANDLSTTARTIRAMVDRLVGAGHLEVLEARGRGHTNRYRMKNRIAPSGFAGTNADENDRFSEHKTGNPVQEKRKDRVTKSGTNVPTNSLKELNKELIEGYINAPADFGRKGADQKGPSSGLPTLYDGPSQEKTGRSPFDDFWRLYPRRIAKASAERAFSKAVKAGADPAAIIAGAQRFAHEREGQDNKYTPHPATWLSGARWADEAPASAASRHAAARPGSWLNAAMQLVGGNDD